MISVSNLFREQIYSPIRKTTAKVIFEILDDESYADISFMTPSESEISRYEQLTNKKRSMTHKYATFEKDSFRLDGSFYIPPKPTDGEYEVGYWSDDLCDEEGIFNPEQVIELDFSEAHNSIGLSITFDIKRNEYATEFEVDVYGENDILIHHEEVTDHSDPIFVLEQPLDGYVKIIITIKKWNEGYRRCKIAEIDFGLIKEYKDDKLISLNILEEINIIGDELPSNEITFTIDNSDKKFNILNPDGFYRFLKERQRVTAEIGLKINDDNEIDEFEFVPIGQYYLVDWKSDENSLTTSFTARDMFEILETIDYVSMTNTTLYNLAEDVLIKAGIENYAIDNRLKTINTNGFDEIINSREALLYIGLAGQSVVYQDRLGVIRIRHIETLSESTGYVYFAGTDSYAGMVTPAVDENYDFKYINFDNAYAIPKINLDKLIKKVMVKVYDGSEEGQEIEIINDGVKKGTTLEIDNPLINAVSHGEKVGEWIIRESNLRVLYEVDWRQNPALECGDAVLIEDSYNEKRRSRIIKNEFNFQGYLSGETQTKGGV